MIVTSGAGYSAAAPTEKHLLAARRNYRNGTATGCLVFHGSGGNAISPLVLPYGTGWAGEGPIKALAEQGAPCMSADWGGAAPWTTDASLDIVDDGYDYFTADLAADDGVLLLGASMGAAMALNFARRNPGVVKAAALVIPALKLGAIYEDNRGGLAAQFLAAWGSEAAWLAAQPTHDPWEFADAFDFPIGVWWASNDPILGADPAGEIAAFQALTDCELHPLGAVGHTVEAAPSDEVAAFLLQHA